ncbi:MAG: cytochrome c-type biogenesis protein CcmH [Acidimicrobiales bacterium]
MQPTIGTFGLAGAAFEPAEDASGFDGVTSGSDEDEETLPPSGRALRTWVFLLAASVVVACGALAAGTGFFRGSTQHPSLYQRTMAIAGEYRCPVCAGESAAESSAPAAADIRNLVRKWLQEGESQAQIRANLVGDYGQSILLKPPASGLDVLVWVVPAFAVALGAAGLTLAFVRWRRALAVAGVEPSRNPPSLGEPSLSGSRAQEPRAQGPFTGAPVSQGSPSGAPAPVQGTLFEVGPRGESVPQASPAIASQAGRNSPPWYRRLMVPAGLALLAAGAGLWLVDRTSPQLPGGTITGSLTGLNVQLTEAKALAGKDPARALEIYGKILASNPNQPIALTAEGWIFAEAGFASQAMPLLTKAEKVDPSYGPAHLYRGLVLLEYDKDPSGAVGELNWYLTHNPSSSLVEVAREALAQAKSEATGAARVGRRLPS